MGITEDYASITKLLTNDLRLKTLMKIPTEDIDNYGKLVTEYFIEGKISYVPITKNDSCRIKFYAAPSLSTNNIFIKRETLVIEIYIPNEIDRDENNFFKRRGNKIVDRLIHLIHNKRVAQKLFLLENHNELPSSTPNYSRMFVQFLYKKVYGN